MTRVGGRGEKSLFSIILPQPFPWYLSQHFPGMQLLLLQLNNGETEAQLYSDLSLLIVKLRGGLGVLGPSQVVTTC